MTIYLPKMTTLSGSSLLRCDWKRIGVHALSVDLESLLVKPGIDVLSKLSALRGYLAWDETLVLNASRIKSSHRGVYQVRSSFDGSLSTFAEDDILEVIQGLKPDYLVVPLVRWAEALIDTKIRLFVPEHEDVMHYEGTWRSLDQDGMLFIGRTQTWEETNTPIDLAVDGLVYGEKGELIDVKQACMAQVFKALVPGCVCEACETKLTLGYFHHLFTHTPGLAQRLLIQHNVVNYPTMRI